MTMPTKDECEIEGDCMPYFVYLLRCHDGTLYCGCTKDIGKRIAKHNAGKGAKYTHGRLPVSLIYWEKKGSLGAALKREVEIKAMHRRGKEALIKSGRAGEKHSGS